MHYVHDATTDASNPLYRNSEKYPDGIRRGGHCVARENEVHQHTGVPRGRDLVDADDDCGRFEERAA